jgi:hypothetical protein
MKPRLALVVTTASQVVLFPPKSFALDFPTADTQNILQETAKAVASPDTKRFMGQVELATKFVGPAIDAYTGKLASDASKIAEQQHVSKAVAYGQIGIAKIGGISGELAMGAAAEIAVASSEVTGPLGVAAGAYAIQQAPHAGSYVENYVNEQFEHANLEQWYGSAGYANEQQAQSTLSYGKPPATIGTDPTFQQSFASQLYARPSASLNTPPGTSCIDYNSIGPSTCKDDPNASRDGLASGGDFRGKWTTPDSTCQRPIVITEQGISGLSGGGSGYGVMCNVSAVVPVQYPNTWRSTLQCGGAASAFEVLNYTFSQLDDNHLNMQICVRGNCQPTQLTKCPSN